ncbi:Apolipoprotein B-100 [Oryzias melastigma]|uniref:Apolipoprotein B-100 n=1 Tax=Oryzias melastigma TaxID=30732 RepID=A0A834CA53_ORYME|nr:Apolipoprotein B-100 [Oryzias melastigma]
MWGARLCLLLLLGSNSVAQQDVESVGEHSPVCFLAKRYGHFKRFVYNYKAETFNSVNGAGDDKSGPRVSCTVEVDVPQTCSFILRTTDCSLSEISGVDDGGNPVYRVAAEAEAFRTAMAKNPLRVAVERQTEVKLYPEDDEPVNILNVKRGIVSALMVPEMTEENNQNVPTVHGVCSTDVTAYSTEDVTVTRDLSKCDGFTAHRRHTSPLALISGMNYPLSKMISSTQTCNYKFDSQMKHMTSGSCTEKHIFLPFSHKNEYGISAVVRQTVTLQETEQINDRIFDINEANLRHLPMEVADDKSPLKTKDALIAKMQKLNTLSQTANGEERAGLFRELVSELRGLKADLLRSITNEMMDISGSLAWQALIQCGTPECTSAIINTLRTYDGASVEVDAVIYAMGMLQHPSRLMVKDLLEMAQNRQSKPIMYALSIATRKLFKSEGVTPEISDVYEFMTSLLGGDCAGEKDLTFLTLRIIGNMGDAMESVDPKIKSTLVKCMRQPATTLSVQLAAIQAFRRMSVTDEVRSNLQRVSQYPKGAVQKRLAAYLMLMRNPQDSDIEAVKKILTQEQNPQVKAFVSSHIHNIITLPDPKAKSFREKILDALQNVEGATDYDFTTTSRNYKLGVAHESLLASVEGNVIFDPSNQLPREVLLETTLEAFGYSVDIWEVGMDGKGFEPTIEALFGENGFFPDTVSKALYWAEGKLPLKVKEVLENWVAPLKPEGQKAPENLMREIVRNFNKLVKDLQNQESPEAMAYLRIMGAELGFIKGSDLKSVAEMYANIFQKITPSKVLEKLMSSARNDIFAHYIFMDNKFIMPTASGLPLTFALSGTFAPGAKGGLTMDPNMKTVSFSPSVGVEFMTQMGVHIPEFVESAVEMHTTVYHESAFKAKITMEPTQVKLSIPAPEGTMKLLRLSNKVMIVGADEATIIPHRQSDSKCKPIFTGLKYCIKTLLPEVGERSDAPYFPVNGETSFAIDIEPTEEVTEYTATVAYKLLSEGSEGRHKVDSLKIILRAEGDQPSEATATMKYNRNRNVFTTQIQIPDFDVESGIKIGVSGSNAKGKSIIFEISNKNELQLSLIGRAKLQAMTDGMLQVQLLVPALKIDATLSSTLNKAEGLTLQLKSDIKLPEMVSVQAVTFKYGEEEAEVQLMSNMNADTEVPVQYSKVLQVWIKKLAEEIMNHQVVNTDMKLRHILNKGIENLRNSISTVEMPSMPENLFMNLESTLKYKFNQNRFTMTIPLPLGGKSSKELRIPRMVTSPQISIPQLSMELAPQALQIPTFTIPSEYDLTLPLLGMMEMSAKMESNYYDWNGKIEVGNNTGESPNYVANIKIQAESPIKVLSFTTEGSYSITDTEGKTIEVILEGSLKHMLINTGFSVLESIAVTENILTTGRFNIQATSSMGLDTSATITTQCTLDSSTLFGDLNADASVTVGSMDATSSYLHTFSFEPAKKEAKMESTLNVNSKIAKLSNKVKVSYENDEFMFDSNTNLNSDLVRHTTKIVLSYKDTKVTFQSDSVTNAEGEKMVRSQIEMSAAAGQATLRIENQAGDTKNRVYSLLTGSLNPSGLEVNGDASINIFSSIASHKATLTLTMNGLTTSCTTTAHHSPLTFENIFHGGIDTSGATLSLTTKGGIKDNKAELNIEGNLAKTEVYFNGMFKANLFDLDSMNRVNFRLNEDGIVFSNNVVGSFGDIRTENTNSMSLSLRSLTLQSKTDNFFDQSNSYMHDISINVERYTASVNMKNNLKVLAISFVNDAQFSAQPYNIQLSGTLMGAYSEEELKHTYEIKFVDAVFSTKTNTVGKLLSSHIAHTTDMEIAGLSMKLNNVANFNSPTLRLDSKIKTTAEPFVLNVDAIFNSNGAVYLFGKHSGEVYSKFLLKAEPTLFTESFEYRASTTHEMEGKQTIKTNVDNKFNTNLSLQKQSVTLKMTTKVNDHAFDEEMTAYNNAEKMGVEMKGVVSTPLFSDASQDYIISGFVKYDKNSDSHFLQIPFVEHLPAVIEKMKVTLMTLMDSSIDMFKNFDSKYGITVKFNSKVAELKEVVDNFDFNLLVQDVKMFLKPVEKFITNLTIRFPTNKVISFLKSIKDKIQAAIKNCNISSRLNAIYSKLEEFLSNYEVEKIVGELMDEVVKIMKQYQVREKIQQIFDSLKSIDIQPLVEKVKIPVQELLNELYSFDFKLLLDDISDYFTRLIQKIKSFDYDTLTTELKEKLAEMSKIPCFGKLYGEFKITSPHYKLSTTADMENVTTTSITPEFKMNLKSKAQSTLKVLDYTVDATAHFALPKMRHLSISESVDVAQSSFTLNHKGLMNLYGLSAQASANTTAKVNTELYNGEFLNNAFFAMRNGIFASVETACRHDFNMAPLRTGSDGMIFQKTVFGLEAGTARLTLTNVAREKYSIQDFSDEITHKSDMEVVMDLHTTKLTFSGDTNSKFLKLEENLLVDACIFRHFIVEAKMETETPFWRDSVTEVKLEAKAEDMRIDVTASHESQLVGQVEGKLSSSLLALITPTELSFDTKNKGDANFILPFKLSGKVNLQNDMVFTLNSNVQQASWTGLARFNQYKYSHLFSLENLDKEVNIISQINAEADLELLRQTITIPEMTLPLVGMKTPRVESFSLWEDAGLDYYLITTQQTYEMNSNLKYIKNPEVIQINVAPVVQAINSNLKALREKVIAGKEKFATTLGSSYDKAKVQYDKYSSQVPETITVPAYKVPVIDYDLSSFQIPLPVPRIVTLSSQDVSSALSKIRIPRISIPRIQTIKIPVMGDLIYEGFIKTAVIDLKTDASILNQDGLSARFDATSSSPFDLLVGKIEGKTNMNTAGEFKMDSILAISHSVLEGSHKSNIALNYETVDASIINTGRLNLPSQTVEINQEITGNPVKGLVVSMSTPSAGLIAVQVQTKRLAQMKARVYGQYPTDLTKDVDIVGLKVSVMDSNKLNLQATWNMEMPYEMMLGLKKQVAPAMSVLSDAGVRAYNKVSKQFRGLKNSLEKVKKQGKVLFNRAVESIMASDISEVMTTAADRTIVILKEYQKKVKLFLNAVVKFLRETKFQIPGYEQKLSGLQVYKEFSAFVADVSEEAVQKIPGYFATMFGDVLDEFQAIQFVFPGSDRIISGKELLDDLLLALREIQDQIIIAVRKLGDISLEDILKKLYASVQFTVAHSERFLQSLRSLSAENLSKFFDEVISDAMNSQIFADVAEQLREIHRIILEYLTAVSDKIYSIVEDVSTEQLRSDIQSWIDLSVKRLNSFHNNVIRALKETTKSVKSYVKVTDRQIDVDIPLPLAARFN